MKCSYNRACHVTPPSLPLTIARFDPSPFGFPKPKVPLLANRLQRLDGVCRVVGRAKEPGGSFRSYTRGRYALGEAYRLTGLGPGRAILAPAYHCLTMLDPAIALGAEVRLYPLKPDLSPDLEQLDRVFESAHGPVKTLLATHYFGLAQDFTRLKAWCDSRKITLVEDCSHVLFTETFQATRTGVFGKFVTSSPYKFFTCEDGGLLHTTDPRYLDSVVTNPAALMDELRGIKRLMEKRRHEPSLAPVDSQLGLFPYPSRTDSDLLGSEYLHHSSHFVLSDIRKAALRSSRWLIRMQSVDAIIAARQRNYAGWLDAVEGLPNCQALYPKWPEDCVPYMFPLLIDCPIPHFHWLKQLGLPIWRWDEMAVSDCAVSRQYQLNLLHLPCHQGLNDHQMDWMFSAVCAVMQRPIEGSH